MMLQYSLSGRSNPGSSSPNFQNIPRVVKKKMGAFTPGCLYRIAGGVATFVGYNRADPRLGFFNFGGKTNNMINLSVCPYEPISALEMLGRQADTGDE